MNDKLVMENYLLVLKSTMEVYVHGTLESSNESVRNILKTCLNETASAQARTYDLMTNYGWYKVNNIKNQDIIKTIKKINQSN